MIGGKKYIAGTVQGISNLFIILFTYAAISKLLIYNDFRVQLSQFPFIAPFADWLVWILPAIQVCIVLLFFSTRFRLLALYASLFLMLIFTGYILAVLKFADAIPCSCGGVFTSLSWDEHLLFNTGFIALAITGITLLHKKGKTERSEPNKLSRNSRRIKI